jgi:valyl-tRNA synthetase
MTEKAREDSMDKTYNPKDFEDRLYKDWEDKGYFRAERDDNKVPFTIMMPPPQYYRSAAHGARTR